VKFLSLSACEEVLQLQRAAAILKKTSLTDHLSRSLGFWTYSLLVANLFNGKADTAQYVVFSEGTLKESLQFPIESQIDDVDV